MIEINTGNVSMKSKLLKCVILQTHHYENGKNTNRHCRKIVVQSIEIKIIAIS